jgi:orotate phosphoribosyltransferase
MISCRHYDALLALLKERSFKHSPTHEFTLASGKKSDFFIDCKQAVLTAEGHTWAGNLMFDIINANHCIHAVAGVELGGCPLASAVSMTSYSRGRNVPALYVRKAAKDHGSQRLFEGDDLLKPGMSVTVVEDVVTTGGSTLAVVKTLRDRGYRVDAVVALVDRLEGARNALGKEGLDLHAVYSRYDFIPVTT